MASGSCRDCGASLAERGRAAKRCLGCVARRERERHLTPEYRRRDNARLLAKARANPQWDARRRAKARARELHRRHSITIEQYDALLEGQGGRCAICGTDVPTGAGAFHVDHDHGCCPGDFSCGQCVRGLLCSRCNQAIGLLRDSPIIVRAAAEYVEGHVHAEPAHR